MTEAVYNNTISLNFLEGGGWVESEHSLITPPLPSFVDCWIKKGMDLKRLTRTLHVMEVKDGIFLLAIISSDRTVYKWTLLM